MTLASPQSRAARLHPLRQWVAFAERLREEFARDPSTPSPWHPSRAEWYALRIGEPVDNESWYDECAQTCAGILGVLQLQPRLSEPPVADWLLAQADVLWRDILAVCLSVGDAPAARTLSPELHSAALRVARHLPESPELLETSPAEDGLRITHFYEHFLAAHDARGRARYGVYYTPQELVQFTVAEVDRLLADELGWPAGLAALSDKQLRLAAVSGTPELRVLDPAAGSGAFLAAILDRIAAPNHSSSSPAVGRSCDSKLSHALARLHGWERLLPAAAVAQLNVAAKLLELGFSFTCPTPLNVTLRNSLRGPHAASDAGKQLVFPVVIGNPPFSGVSRVRTEWIDHLLRGRAAEDPWRRSYFTVGGRPLGERKVWLNDDYVKFYRLGQWLLDRAGAGVLALVSNHGFLDNVTFRGMRASLLDSFARITIVDLHGNRKRHETTPTGAWDGNVFGIEQGTAVALLRKDAVTDAVTDTASGEKSDESSDSARRVPSVLHVDLWGSPEDKRRWLAERAELEHAALGEALHAAGQTYRPEPPLFLLRPGATTRSDDRGLMRLNEVMPIHCTAPVTARDHFIVAFTRAELEQRLGEFADLRIADDDIRSRYFQRTRSPRYAPGDTRGWSLTAARRRLAETPDWQTNIIDCLYRPFDVRVVFWADWMIDWPRPALMQQLSLPGNWCLISRRQMLPGKSCNFFFATPSIALDGVIRSDNRGSELLLPIYVRAPESPRGRAANFSEEFIHRCERQTGLVFDPDASSCSDRCFGPEQLAAYLYGLFHLPQYREQYAPLMCSGFPPVLVPRSADDLRALAAGGHALLACHGIGQTTSDLDGPEDQPWMSQPACDRRVTQPRFDGERVWINPSTAIARVTADEWHYAVGAHQVARKWLADRRGRTLQDADALNYQRLILAVNTTLAVMRRLALLADSRSSLSELFA